MTRSTRTNEKMVPVLYCDIDGTIRWGKDELGRFVNTAEDVRVFDGVPELLWAYKKLGWRIVGVSNQGGIALGYMDMATCVKAMTETQKQTNYAFDKLTWCSHHPDAKDPEMAVCWCRKPKAGMVVETALLLSEQTGEIYPPHLGLFVGDRFEDAECAMNAGLQFLGANAWRTGEHLASLGNPELSSEEVDRIARAAGVGLITTEEARAALRMDEPLPDEALQRSLEITGVKTKTVPVHDLMEGAEFMYEGFLYTVVETSEIFVMVKPNSADLPYVSFYDPEFIEGRQMSPESPLWTTEVMTDA